MGGVSRELDYQHDWPVPGFVGLTLAQARALAEETGITLLEASRAEAPSARVSARVVRQSPLGMQRRRPTTVTVWVDDGDTGAGAVA